VFEESVILHVLFLKCWFENLKKCYFVVVLFVCVCLFMLFALYLFCACITGHCDVKLTHL